MFPFMLAAMGALPACRFRFAMLLVPMFPWAGAGAPAAESGAFECRWANHPVVIDGRAARLLHYDQRYSRPILGPDFPMIRPVEGRQSSGRGGSTDRARQERSRVFLREVDSRLAARIDQFGLPVVLVASDRTAGES